MISDLRRQIARTVALVVTVLTLGRIKVDTSGQPTAGAKDGEDPQGIGRLHREETPAAPGSPGAAQALERGASRGPGR